MLLVFVYVTYIEETLLLELVWTTELKVSFGEQLCFFSFVVVSDLHYLSVLNANDMNFPSCLQLYN